MSSERVYLDHNASAPLRPEAREAVCAALDCAGNASSVHREGRAARGLIENARESVAALIGVRPAQIVFTSGGTEANVMALSPAWLDPAGPARLFVSAVEHPSVLKGGQFARDDVETLPVDGDGVVDIEAARGRFRHWREASGGAPFLTSVMLANNETGAIQPVEAVGDAVHEFGGALHSDAVQAAGKIALASAVSGCDLVTLSSHKIGGPKGAGALVLVNDRLGFSRPLLRGGGQERGYRAGTEDVAAIAGFGAAAEAAGRDLAEAGRIEALRDRLEAEILRIAPDAVIMSQGTERLPNTICFASPGMQAETLLMAFDLDGVALSAGSACSSGRIEPSHVLAAMSMDRALSAAALRVSLGWNTAASDVERFTAVWARIVTKFGERRNAA